VKRLSSKGDSRPCSGEAVGELVPESPDDLLVVKLVSSHSLQADDQVVVLVLAKGNVDLRSFSNLLALNSVLVLEHH
jgi:hypothetical protein